MFQSWMTGCGCSSLFNDENIETALRGQSSAHNSLVCSFCLGQALLYSVSFILAFLSWMQQHALFSTALLFL